MQMSNHMQAQSQMWGFFVDIIFHYMIHTVFKVSTAHVLHFLNAVHILFVYN